MVEIGCDGCGRPLILVLTVQDGNVAPAFHQWNECTCYAVHELWDIIDDCVGPEMMKI